MDITSKNHFWPISSPEADRAGQGASPYDWHGLAGRLAAAHALRCSLGKAVAGSAGGSFDAVVARSIADWAGWRPASAAFDVNPYECGLNGINPMSLADRKTTPCIRVDDARAPKSGDRGWK